MFQYGKRVLPALMALLLLAGCGSTGAQESSAPSENASVEETAVTQEMVEEAFTDEVALEDVVIEEEAVALAGEPAVPTMLTPVASGKQVKKTDKAIIDYSNTTDGYVMVQYTASTTKKLKAQVKGPSGTTYTYNLTSGVWATFPLSDGNGSYKVTVYENISGTKYSTVTSVTFTAKLKNEFAPFLMPNQYVNFNSSSKTVAKAQELVGNQSDVLKKVEGIYNYVVKNFTYDKQKAATVQSGYLPDVDAILASKKGICFDYAAVMAAMLRSQNVPTKLVVGYSGKIYHAWISVYSEKTGWVDGAIYFDGTSWKLMDPTFASSANQSKQIMEYIGNGANYSAKYFY